MYFMAATKLEFKAQGDKYKATCKPVGKATIFLDCYDNPNVAIYMYPSGYDPVLYKEIKSNRPDLMVEINVPGSGDISVDVVSSVEVKKGGYVPSEKPEDPVQPVTITSLELDLNTGTGTLNLSDGTTAPVTVSTAGS